MSEIKIMKKILINDIAERIKKVIEFEIFQNSEKFKFRNMEEYNIIKKEIAKKTLSKC